MSHLPLDHLQTQQYSLLYMQADEDKDGVIGPADALRFFQRSGLSKEVLAAIWATANPTHSTPLQLPQFVLSCQLIALAQNGRSPSLQELSQHQQVPVPQFSGVVTTTAPQTTAVQPQVQQMSNVQQPDQGRREVTWSISNAMIQEYSAKFSGLDTDRDGFVSGPVVAQYFFSISELPQATLAKVWELADVTRDGKLDVKEFCLASFIVSAIKAGHQIPTPLPQSLITSLWPAQGAQGSSGQQQQQQQSPWAISQQEQTYGAQVFDSTDTERRGVLTGTKVRELFVQSGLPNADLATIFSLSDMDKDGNLNRTEFIVAMKLIKMRSAGASLPSDLPAELRASIGLAPSSYSSSGSSTAAKTTTTQTAKADDSTKIEDLQNQLKALEATNKELSAKIMKVTSERNQFESSYKKVVQEKRDSNAELRDNVTKLQRALDKTNEVEGKLIQAEARLSVLASRGADPTTTFTAQLETKDKELASLREQLRTTEQTYRNKLAETDSKLQDALERLSLLEASVSSSVPVATIPVQVPPPFQIQQQTPVASKITAEEPSIFSFGGLPPPMSSQPPSTENPNTTTTTTTTTTTSYTDTENQNPFLVGLNIPNYSFT